MTDNFDLSIYFVADPACCKGRAIFDVVLEAAEAGVTMVQYRDKSGDMPLISANAAMLAQLLKPFGIPLLVNDHVDIAFAAGADGVHIGQGDCDPAEARKTLGEDAIIGLTAFNEDQISAVDPEIIDYIGTGPVHPTQTDKGKPVLGVDGFAELCALSPVRVVGIGGITPENAAPVLQAGADGVAMMRSISEASDISEAVKAFQTNMKVAA